MTKNSLYYDEASAHAPDVLGDTQPLRSDAYERAHDYWDVPRTRVTVSVIIPTKNEAGNLPHVLPRIPVGVDEVILVDGHSTDDTIAVARTLCPNIRVLRQQGQGKGDALLAGFRAARGDIIVMMDADGSTDPEEIPLFVQAVVAGADVAKGSRFIQGGGSADITAWRKGGNDFLCFVVNLLFRVRYSDLCYGFNAFRRSSLACIDMHSTGFEVEAWLTLQFGKAGLRIAEVPSYEHPRIHGMSKLHPIRDGLRILRTIFAERVRRHRAADQQASPLTSVTDVWLPPEEMRAFAESDTRR